MTQNAGTILIVDDDHDVLLAARLLLKQHHYQVHTEKEPRRLPALLRERAYDVILLDMNFTEDASSGGEGFYWLQEIPHPGPGSHGGAHHRLWGRGNGGARHQGGGRRLRPQTLAQRKIPGHPRRSGHPAPVRACPLAPSSSPRQKRPLAYTWCIASGHPRAEISMATLTVNRLKTAIRLLWPNYCSISFYRNLAQGGSA